MTQQLSPWLETAYGWSYGEGGWNSGMDSNLLKFSVMFDRNVDSIVSSLPAAVNGQVHYNTSDNRIYFAVATTYFSTPVPKWFTVIERSTGNTWQFNGTTLAQVEKLTSVITRLDDVEVVLESLGTAAFEDISAFATQAALDVVAGQAQAYTDSQIDDTLDSLAAAPGAGLLGYDSGETYSAGTVGQAIQDLSTQVASQGVYVGLSPTSTLSMTATDAEVFGVSLTEPVTTLTLLGGGVGEVATINVIFSQDSTGHVVTVPANVILADGVTEIASSSAGDISLVTFTKVNGVDLWYHELRKVYSTVIPPVAASSHGDCCWDILSHYMKRDFAAIGRGIVCCKSLDSKPSCKSCKIGEGICLSTGATCCLTYTPRHRKVHIWHFSYKSYKVQTCTRSHH